MAFYGHIITGRLGIVLHQVCAVHRQDDHRHDVHRTIGGIVPHHYTDCPLCVLHTGDAVRWDSLRLHNLWLPIRLNHDCAIHNVPLGPNMDGTVVGACTGDCGFPTHMLRDIGSSATVAVHCRDHWCALCNCPSVNCGYGSDRVDMEF